METVDGAVESEAIRRIRSILEEYPVSLAILFGSRARGTATPSSDLDLAVAFEDLEPGQPGYNDALLGLGADLEVAVSIPVDVVDLGTTSPSVARRALREGDVLVGDLEPFVRELADDRPDSTKREGTSRERFDAALARIEEYLA